MECEDGIHAINYIENLHTNPLQSAEGYMRDLLEDVHSVDTPDDKKIAFAADRLEQVEHLSHVMDHRAFVKRLWFPLTLRYLRGVRRKRIAEFLMPRIVGHVLAVELQDAISACYCDADFLAEAPNLAKVHLKHTLK